MNILKKKKIEKKPWGREIWFANIPGHYMGKILEIDGQVSMHVHRKKEETLYLTQGMVKVYTLWPDGTEYLFRTLRPGDSIHIEPGTPHSFKSVGKKKAIFFEASTPFPEDSVRLKDYYGRPVCDTWEGPDDMADRLTNKGE